MNMRRGLGLGWALVTVAIAGVVAWFAYHAGLATTITSSGVAPAVRDGGYYGYAEPWGFGFGLFPLLFFILLLFFLVRRRRWGGHWGGHGYGGYGGYKGGRGWGDGQSHEGHGLPPVIDEKLKAWHESAHGAQPAEPSGDNPGTPPGGTPGGISGQA